MKRILDKIAKQGRSLSQRNTMIRLGLATGSNEAFLLTPAEYEDFISCSPEYGDILKPILRGREIQRYVHLPVNTYIILAANGIDIPKLYPKALEHFEEFGERFKKRGAQGQHWWNLRACAFLHEFEREKVAWIELSGRGRFAVCEPGIHLLNTAYFMIPPQPFTAAAIVAILNSTVVEFFIKVIAGTSGMGVTRWINTYVRRVPIPDITRKEMEELGWSVADIRKDILCSGVCSQRLESDLDARVAVLYGLTAEEYRLILEQTRTPETFRTACLEAFGRVGMDKE